MSSALHELELCAQHSTSDRNVWTKFADDHPVASLYLLRAERKVSTPVAAKTTKLLWEGPRPHLLGVVRGASWLSAGSPNRV